MMNNGQPATAGGAHALTLSQRATGRSRVCVVRELYPEDLGALSALHGKVIATLADRRVLYLRQRAFFERLLSRPAGVVGAWLGDELAGYACMHPVGLAPDGYGRCLGMSDAALERTMQCDGSGVDPAHRGWGIQGVLNAQRLTRARLLGYAHLVGIVSVYNPPSVISMVRSGMAAAGLHRDEDGVNLVLHAALRADPRPEADASRWVVLSDVAGHGSALRAGWLGVSTRRVGEVTNLRYTPAVSEAA